MGFGKGQHVPHNTPLISTISVGLVLAFIFGLAAQKLRLPPIIGYLAAGIVVGPFTPGYVADQKLATELAELGVILLMFGVGLHFSLKDLMSVRAIAIPGAIGQILVATLLGMGLAWLLGWTLGAGIVFGLALSVASTVVLLRALQERRLVWSERGRIAVGWLIVEDLAMVLTLVLVPPLAGLLGGEEVVSAESAELARTIGFGQVTATMLLTLVKVSLFMAIMLVIGRKFIPSILHYVAHTGSRELFRLAVLAIALGVAFTSATLFGVSFALGAFFAGMVLAESPLSTQAAKETLPLRDAFAVLFFVSVGMLFNPAVLVNSPLAVVATFGIIVFGKSAAAFLIVRAFGYPTSVALTISASLAQIGEFSFILVVMGVSLEILPEAARDLVVAGAILSILVNPLLFFVLDKRLTGAAEPVSAALSLPEADAHAATASAAVAPAVTAAPAPKTERPRDEAPTRLDGHAILIGHGRVGSRVSNALIIGGVPLLVVEEEGSALSGLRQEGLETYIGSSGAKALLDRINIAGARWIITAIPDAFESGHVIEEARAINPAIRVIARAHSDEAMEYLKGRGADMVVMGEDEIARAMARHVLDDFARGPPAPTCPPSEVGANKASGS